MASSPLTRQDFGRHGGHEAPRHQPRENNTSARGASYSPTGARGSATAQRGN